MKMVKKMLAVVLAGTLVLSVFTGCDKKAVVLTEALKLQLGAASVTYDAENSRKMSSALSGADEAALAVIAELSEEAEEEGYDLEYIGNNCFFETFSANSDMEELLTPGNSLSGFVPSAMKGARGIEDNAREVRKYTAKITRIEQQGGEWGNTIVCEAYDADSFRDKDIMFVCSSAPLPDYVSPRGAYLVVLYEAPAAP